MSARFDAGRRHFLKVSALVGGGLAVGVYLPGCDRRPSEPPRPKAGAPAAQRFAPNAWVRITPDDMVTIVVDKSEMGQGVMTSMPMLVAEELDADWQRVKLVQAPADPVYRNPKIGIQATGGSTSVSSSWEPLRQAGATARAMLVAAAAREWQVTPESCRTEKGKVLHPDSGRQARYGELASLAARQPLPQDVPLKSPKDFQLIGKPLARLDTPAKVDGSAVFGIDVKVPDMLIATVAHCPVFGGKLAGYDATQAKAIPGVRAVLPVESGIAVVARDYWTARKGLQAVQVQWDLGPNAKLDSAGIDKLLTQAAGQPGAVAHDQGNAEQALGDAAKTVEAVYQLPFAAHATMEPMNCTAHVRGDACEVWVPTQSQTGVQMTAAKITGLPQEQVIVHTTLLGGGFGRRFEQDFVAEAVQLSQAVGAPVKLIWPREEDMQHDFYRPAMYNQLRAGLDRDGMPVAWTHRLAGPSIMSRVMPQRVKDGIDPSSVEGAAELPYAIPNIHVDYVMKDTGVPVGFWRSVGNSHTAFVKESFLDELAAAGGKDPLALRRALLSDAAREREVLELAADKAGWGGKLPAGHGRGLAVHKSFGSYAAQVAEVSVAKDGTLRVHRIVCALDCGTVVNPDTVRAQVESAIIYGLTATLKGPITLAGGRVQQSNFNDYPLLRLDETPLIEVHLLPSREPPSGVGEPAVPPVAPAVANAVFAATGKRIRHLPIRAEDLRA